jgi:septum formation protein
MAGKTQIVLASASPRRKQLLEQIGIRCRIHVCDIDETPHEGEAAIDFVARMALEKARAVEHTENLPVLAADTVVAQDGLILGKPKDKADAVAMLQRLQGRRHEVITAVALGWQNNEYLELSQSFVWFKPLSFDECEAYWRSGEPVDKAGAYGIQGLGAVFVERIEGSYSGVMGLPLFETAKLLERIGINPLS